MRVAKKEGVFLLLLFLLFSFPAGSQAGAIRLSVAASLTDAVKELNFVYTRENPDVTILPNFGGSGALAKQIALGAPADLYISANKKWMDYLVQEGKIAGETVRGFAANSLVFLGASGTPVSSLDELPTLSRIAMGSPGSVPAGQYTRQALRAKGIYKRLRSQSKLVMAKDVRQALLYADRGEVDGAFVYKTDALIAERAEVLFVVPGNLHDPIVYPAGLTREGRTNRAAVSLLDFFGSPRAATILAQYGFLTIRLSAGADTL